MSSAVETFWIFGRGLSIACGFDWNIQDIQNYNSLPRNEKIQRILEELTYAAQSRDLSLQPYHSLFELLDGKNHGSFNHTFTTLNWDTLGSYAMDQKYPNSHPTWLEPGGIIYHWNGRCPSDDRKVQAGLRLQSPFILPADTHDYRNQLIHRSIEGNYAFNKMPQIGGCYILVGVSLSSKCDETILLLMKHMDQGDRENTFVVVNPSLESRLELVQKLQPLSKRSIVEVKQGISSWAHDECPELSELGILS